MSNEFKREERYIVFKMSDLGNSLKGDEIRRLAREYAENRKQRGKKPLECVVVESDWSEYEPTWQAIEARMTGAQPAPSDEYVGWYCAHCQRGVDASEVTYHEQHQVCGRVITEDKPPKPAPSVPDGVAEALQRLIENGAVLGPASSEDALLVARYRQRLLACAPSVPEGVSSTDTSQLAGVVSTEIVHSYPPPFGWLRAIDEALVVTHLGVANASDTYEQAKAKLDSLLGFHVDVATDPAVNGGWKLAPIAPEAKS